MRWEGEMICKVGEESGVCVVSGVRVAVMASTGWVVVGGMPVSGD